MHVRVVIILCVCVFGIQFEVGKILRDRCVTMYNPDQNDLSILLFFVIIPRDS